MIHPEISLFIKEEINKKIHVPEDMKSIPLHLDRLEMIVPTGLDKTSSILRGDVYRELTLNDGKKVFILNASVYRVYFEIENIIEEFLSKKGCHFSIDQSPLWNRGMDLSLNLFPRVSGLLKNLSGRTIQIEKGSHIGTLYFKQLQ